MSNDWADDAVDAVCELTIEALSHEEWRIKFQAEIASALRAAYARGQMAALRHAAAKALSYAERELYDELIAAADELEKQ